MSTWNINPFYFEVMEIVALVVLSLLNGISFSGFMFLFVKFTKEIDCEL
jgi:hypothetical protein